MWVTDWASNGNGPSGWIKKLDSNGNVILTVNMDNNPVKPVFDGTNIWVPNLYSNSIKIVQASTGSVVATLTGNGLNGPYGMAFDGKRILVPNFFGNSVSLWRAADFTPIGSFYTGAGSQPVDAASDGLNFWISLNGTGQLLRF